MKRKKINSEKKSENGKKESELEEEIKEEEVKKIGEEFEQDFFEEPVSQMRVSTETKAPVLERIIERQMPVENSVEIGQQKEAREEKRIDYSPTTRSDYDFVRRTENEEKKYETNFVPPVLSRREMPSNAVRQDFLRPQGENWSNRINESQLNEIEFVEQETKLPFEEQQKKYKRFKLR